ncbi:MAG: abortive infection family protein [Clostridiales bacterium]|nr:abortive infection family protein [Clostridiales bacterium]
MANKIREANRQKIINLLIYGIRNTETKETTKIFWSGIKDEHDFLERLYDLNSMPSTDERYKTAYNDILQHRVNNTDWDEGWVFSDGRFAIKNGPDEQFLRFLCEVFHPQIRKDDDKWQPILERINGLLRTEDFELVSIDDDNTGWEHYVWKNLNGVIHIENAAKTLKQKFSSEYISKQIDTMMKSQDDNPTEAIGKAKELIESCCKTILEKNGVSVDKNWDIVKLVNETMISLEIHPKNVEKNDNKNAIASKILGSLISLANNIAEFRNNYGSGHGKSANYVPLPPRHAKLAIGCSATLVNYLWDTYEWKSNNAKTI